MLYLSIVGAFTCVTVGFLSLFWLVNLAVNIFERSCDKW